MQQHGMRFERAVAQHRIGADLPENQIGMRGDDGGVEAGQHLVGLLAVDAAIEHRDVAPREALRKLGRKAARIACRRRVAPAPGCRGRADRNDRQWLAARQAPRGVPERMVEVRKRRQAAPHVGAGPAVAGAQ